MINLVEVSPDQITLTADHPIDGLLNFPITSGQDICQCTAGHDPLVRRHRVRTTVSHDPSRAGETVDQIGAAALKLACPGLIASRVGSPASPSTALIFALNPRREQPKVWSMRLICLGPRGGAVG